MPDTAIDSLSTFIAEMSKLQRIGDELRPAFWFRGHAKVCWKLLPRVLRDDFVNRVNEFNVRPNDPNSLDTAIETTEKSINDRFRREGASLLPAKLVDIYFLAQHYGLPTRLLDWTTNPLAALFFAVSQEHDHDGEVISVLPNWRLTFGDEFNPRRAGLPYHPPVGQRYPLVKKTIKYLFDLGRRPFRGGLIVPLQPDLRSARMLQQGACFTLHMPGCPPINENPTNSKRFRIPSSRKRVLLEELRAVGVNWATLFPDLDHLAKEIREDFSLG
jgi:hypothetical protein